MRHGRGTAAVRWRASLLCLPLVFTIFGVACATPDPQSASPQITIVPAAGEARPAHVQVTGLRKDDLSSLRGRTAAGSEWPALMSVTVADAPSADAPRVLGRWDVTETAITFTPRFPFDPGRSYHVVFDPSRLPHPRATPAISADVRLPAPAGEPTSVVAVHPAADVVPENLLRVYVEFSAPMGSAGGLDYVKLVELSGPGGERVEEGAFLPLEADFWSPDHKRYTLFLDPGRVKDDILPNRESGRALRAGGRYAIDIAQSWTDANGRPLSASYRQTFRVEPAVNEAIRPADWKFELPAAGTRDALTVRFPRPLDHGVLARALAVEASGQAFDGESTVEGDDTRWVFRPAVVWRTGEYSLVAQSFLEDPQGNRIGRAFEELAEEALTTTETAETIRLPFTIRTR